jgi:hypothetical protein
MDHCLDTTRGFQSRDPHWHGAVEAAATVSGVVDLMRNYLASLAPEQYAHLPESCRALRVKAEDDIEYWTLKLSQRLAGVAAADVDTDLAQDLFNHLLHASLRISHIHRAAVAETP